MLFNSYAFIFGFLPLCVAVFFILGRLRFYGAALTWLVLASLFFYGWWDPKYLALIGGSILFNFIFGRLIALRAGQKRAQFLMILGVLGNLGALGYFKYAHFIVQSVNDIAATDFTLGVIILPLAISFFTFQQITFLVDAYRGETREYNFLHYCLFVTFFPQLIAGPIVHHKDMLPQFERLETFHPKLENLVVGGTIFIIGLFKKAVLADGIAVYATPVFVGADAGVAPDFFLAWFGALAYAFQLYFDFSGYSDMAIGCARLFGVRLPLNFNSPYKALNISDFWRRWHMTLSRFLRDYLYIGLGGNRKGPLLRYRNLMLTMILGGLWHGAGWTFVIWGTLHGIYLVAQHGWSHVMPRAVSSMRLYAGFAWVMTFLAVLVGWVFFRATTFEGAFLILEGMTGQHGISLPVAIWQQLGPLQAFLSQFGVEPSMGGGSVFFFSALWIIVLFPVALFAPNTQELMKYAKPALEDISSKNRLIWQPNGRWAFYTAGLAVAGIFALPQVSEFLYFQF